MKLTKFLFAALIALSMAAPGVYGQCTSADIMEPGFNFITSSRGCAPFTIEIQTLYLNSTTGTIYHVDWGDGSAVEDYTQANPYPNGPIISHLYANAPIGCGYQVTISVENTCNPLGTVVLEPINVIVWTDDVVTSDPDVYRVCQGFASSISFNDDSNWNCFPRTDARENADPRWIQWVYGDPTNTGRIPNVRVDGVKPGGFPYYKPSLGTDPVYPVTAIDQTSLNVQIPPTTAADIGKDFYVTLNNWNTCNAYDEDLTNGSLNPVNAGGDNAPRTSVSRIVIVDTPTPDFVARKENSSNPVAWDYCIEDIIYFDDESTRPSGSSLGYTWEFYDGPNMTDGLLATKNSRNPVYSFSKGGQKLVRLIVGDNNAIGGCTAVVEKIVNITPTSIAQISASATKFCKTPGSNESFSVTFNDVSIGSTVNTEWKWEFYDENGNQVRTEPASGYSTASPVPYTQSYTNPGVYKVVLISRDVITLCDTRDELNVVIYNNPEPKYVTANVCDGNATLLIDQTTLSKVNNSQLVKWEWDMDYDMTTFVADTIFDNTRPDTLTNFFSYGLHRIALRATNDQNGCRATYVDSVLVYQNPVAAFAKDSVEGCSPLEVTFNNTVDATQPVGINEYVWCIDYGSGFVDTLHNNPNAPGYTPFEKATFENWSTQSKTFYVKLKAMSEDGCIAFSGVDSVKVLPSVKPGFYYTNYEPLAKNCSPQDVNFKVGSFTSALSPNSYTWSIYKDDSLLQSSTTPGDSLQFYYNFTATGNGINNYAINLKANITDICVGDSTLLVNVNPIPVSEFTIDTVSVSCDKIVLEIDAQQKGLLKYDWAIDKGGILFKNSDYGDNFEYEILRPAPGSANLDVSFELTASNYAFCQSDLTSQSVQVIPEPQLLASFVANPEIQEYPNATVTINNTSSRTNATHFWDFGDSTTDNAENPQPHTYAEPGNYTIRLQLEEAYCESEDSVNVFIQPTAPIADFSFDPGSGCAPLTVHFTNLTQYGDPTQYHWYFGAGEGESTGEHPVHTYYEPGIYSVKLEATNKSGITDAAVKRLIIEVYSVPHADFTIRPEQVKLPDDPIYTTNLSFEADTYLWDFGDGTTMTDFEPSHTYLDTGRYDITLVANTDKGCADTITYENVVEVVEGNEIKIPNAFTPSLDGPTGGNRWGNGRNDIFYPVTEGVIAYRMQIYNRWGELLFATEDTNKGWDGYYKGRLCAPDVYIYKINFKFIDGREVMKFGDIALIR